MSLLFKSLALTSMLVCGAVSAQTIAGAWKTIDDSTGKERSIVRITEANGVFSGKVEKLLAPDAKPDAKCDKCTDARKDQPIIGMTIIRDVKKNDDVFDGGDILDANNGKLYKVRMKLSDAGKKLEVRGYIGTPMLGRSQNWVRVE
ncbi:MAG: DUF2147 domain-containing protein [Betaproteobacteria bacterium]|nr:MAG: DUF2147 domain-containing protein [Betaproteobacteria bacterium]TAG44706.1 MAG: DUF2147 domain-containing protein [Betaproteobacteria bacterium]